MPMRVWLRHPEYEDEFPSSFTLAMVPCVSMSGLVKDEDGRPVFTAKVSPVFVDSMGEPQGRAEIRLGEDALTDAGGRWSCPSIPSGQDGARLVGIRIRHPDFQSSEVHGDELQEAIGPNGTVVLRRGIVVVGRVVDRAGHPLGGARVGAGSDWFGSDPPIVDTDEHGRFRLGHLRPRRTVITVQAKGQGPEAIQLDARAALPPVELKLGAPRTISGRVVDRDGKPLTGIQVAVVFWRGFHTLDWKAETGLGGRFRWDDAPREEVWLDVYADGFIALHNRVVRTTEAQTVITLARTLRVSGTVVDCRTRKPVSSFTLTPGTDSPDGSVTHWDRSRSRRMSDGRYDFRFAGPAAGAHVVKIEAEGYAPGISPIADDEGDARIEFELMPAVPPRG